MVKYAIWDQTHLISDKFLRQYIKNTFYELMSDFDKMYVHHNPDTILENNMDCDYLAVFGSGHITKNMNLKTGIEKLCRDNDFFIAGHIIHHVNTYPFLHPQMFIINMNKYKEYGCPMIGYYEESEVLELHKPERSPENVHDDYTPLWLKPSNEIFSCINRKFGWNLIHISLNNNVPVLNFSDEIRWSKQYLYPTDKSHAFSKCLQQLSKNELKFVPTNLNENQERYIKNLIQTLS
jgi:hypothetical protein